MHSCLRERGGGGDHKNRVLLLVWFELDQEFIKVSFQIVFFVV